MDLKDELDKVQAEYLKLLQSITSRITTEELLELLDEVQLFWYQKRNVIHLSAQYLFRYSDAYFLTAATIFDIEDTNQNIFFLNGKYQIFDDPIPSYLKIISKKEAQDGAYSSYLKELSMIVAETILDEIRLLENPPKENFFIIPLRYYLDLYSLTNHLDETALEIVNHYFKRSVNFLTLSTIENVEEIVDTRNMSNILLFDGDDFSLSITERIEGYVKKNKEIVPGGMNDAQILYTALFGGIRQALDVIETTFQFNVVPFFRSFTPFSKYSQIMKIILENSSEEKGSNQISILLNKATIEYLIYFEFSKRNNGHYTISGLKEKAQQIEFEKKLKDIEIQMNNSANFSNTAEKIGQVIYDLLS